MIILIRESFGLDPYEKSTQFLFCERKADRIKGSCFEGHGFCLVYKKLETYGRFQWPRWEDDLKEIACQQFKWLMEGLTITPKNGSQRWNGNQPGFYEIYEKCRK